MASKGGGKIRNKGEHSPVKPYEQPKSFFQRITDSLKDVLRPSWLATDPHGGASSPPPTVEKNNCSTTFQEEQDVWEEEDEPSQHSPLPSPSHAPPSPVRRPLMAVAPGNTDDQQQQPMTTPGGSTSLWSVTPGGTGAPQQVSAVSSNGPTGQSSTLASNAASRGPGGPSRGVGGWTGPMTTQHCSPSLVRQRQCQQHRQQGCHRSSVGRVPLSQSVVAASACKRQKLWAPDVQRKGRPLQPAVQSQPAFKMSVFRSSSLLESAPNSSFYLGKTNYGGASSYRRQSLNTSSSYQGLPMGQKAVTPKPVNKSGSAVLSSSATQILKTLERLSDAKRARVDLRDSESLLAFTPSSYRRRSRPLQRGIQSPSMETRSGAATSASKSRQLVASPCVSVVPALNISPQKADDEVTADLSGDDDVEVIESSEEESEKVTELGSCGVPAPGQNAESMKSLANSQQHTNGHSHQGSPLSRPATVTPSPGLFNAQPPVAVGFGSPPSTFITPTAWGSTAPKPKSIIAGTSKPGPGTPKVVSFKDTGGASTPAAQLKSGSVMDILASSSSSKSSAHLKQGCGTDAFGSTGAAPAPAITTSFPPAIPSSSSNTSCPGGVHLGASVSTALGSASADFRSPAGAEGFKFGSSSSTSTAFSATGSSRLATSTTETEASGFMFGKSTPDNSQTVASSGFTFGKSTPDNSQTVASSGFTFGKSTPDNSQTVASSGFTFGKSTPDNSQIVASSGFTFGKSTPDSSQTVASSGFTFGKSTPDSSQTVASSGFTFGKSTPDNSQTVASSGFTFGVQRERKDSAARNDAGEVTSTETSVIDSCTTNTCNRVSLVSGGDRMCHSVSDDAAPSSSGAAHSTSPGCSQFSRTTHSQSSPPFVFGSSVSTEVTLNGSNSCEKQSTGQKTSSTNSGFIFGGTAKAPSTSQNGHHLFAPSSVGSTGFVFGASGGSGFVFGASGGSGFASSRSGESGVVTRPHSGQHGSALFSSPAMSTVNGDNGAKETGTLGEVSAVNGDTGVSDNGTVQGVGPADVTTPPLTSSKPADDGGEPFTFATPTAVTSSAVAFNFGQLSKGRQRSGVAFNTQTNAASSKDTGPLPPLGAESSTNTGHFSFTVGAGSQSNAAAASSLTPGTGFSFSGSVQPSFSFGADKLSNSTASGADKLSNSTASAFQFASPRAADRAAAHTASQSTFGQAASSTSDPPTPLFTAPTTTPNSFSIGAGDGPRRLKRAVRRVPKQ
ncbi:uncharacterized protein LOC143279666 isoform X2 [Babylonia areolata]|uniref:uncharacterized protein LOC143279666 isoform X2 n=1 Tax=Babylonia areolata TaxID=304850 RepID=UPI003FD358ED